MRARRRISSGSRHFESSGTMSLPMTSVHRQSGHLRFSSRSVSTV